MASEISQLHAILLSVLLLVPGTLNSWAQSNLGVPDTRGPVVNTGMKVQVNEEGVQAPGFHWKKPPQLPSGDWTAKLIHTHQQRPKNTIGPLFRKEIFLKEEPKRVIAWLTSTHDSPDYIFYINGRLASRGPSEEGYCAGAKSNRLMYDFRDFTPLFHQGTNCLAAELSGPDAFLFEVDAEYPDGSHERFVSDETWKSIYNPNLKKATIPEEDQSILGTEPGKDFITFDASAEPVGWQTVGFDDSNWPSVIAEKFHPESPLYLSQLPPLMEGVYPFFEITRVHGAVKVPAKPFKDGHPIVITGDGEFAVHFKRIIGGLCGIKIMGAKGAIVYLQECETNSPGGHEGTAIGQRQTYPIYLRDGIQYFESTHTYGFSTVNIIARHVTNPIEIMDVSAISVSQPVAYQGSFECSDPFLNSLWKSGRWSTQMCMQTSHLDSPSNGEGIFDCGDYLVQDLVNYNTMGDNFWLARQDLQKEGWALETSHFRIITFSYMLYWVMELLNYYDYSGDKSAIVDLAPDVHALMDRFTSYIGKNGLVCNAPTYFFCDWSGVRDDKNPSITGSLSHPSAGVGQGFMTALFYQALKDAARVSELTHDAARIEKYTEMREKIAEAYNRELWNEDKGLYRDGVPFMSSVKPHPRGKADNILFSDLPEDKQMESFSIQNNVSAVLYGLAPANRRAAIIDKIMEYPNGEVTTYYMHYVFDGMDRAGVLEKYAVPFMHYWHIIPDTQTTRELAWLPIGVHHKDGGGERNDYTHGWISTPAYQMSSKILGVVPTSPGFATFDIRPTLCGLEFARGRVPTPHGPIDVDWQNKRGLLAISVGVPNDTKATLAIPLEGNANPKITSNGKVIWDGQQPGKTIASVSHPVRTSMAVELNLDPGKYQFEMQTKK